MSNTAAPSQEKEPKSQVYSEINSSQSSERMEMEAKPSRDGEEQEGPAEAEMSDIEKPSIPLNSLKMMFERGQTPDKASPKSSLLFLTAFRPPIRTVTLGKTYKKTV